MAISTARESSESGVQLIPMVSAPSASRHRHRAQHVRRSTACGYAYQDVPARESPALQIALSDLGIILGRFGGFGQRRIAARHDPLHQFRRNIESRWALRRVQDPQPAAGTGADVE